MPANSKAIRKRIKSVASTKKITRTMEMVATSKLQRTQGRVVQSRPYVLAMSKLMRRLSGAAAELVSPLFEQRSPSTRVLVLVITANRGLCGGFNTNLVRKARTHIADLKAQGLEIRLVVAGKKGISQLRFRGHTIDEKRTDLTDNPSFDDAVSLAGPLLDAFLSHEVDRVDVVFADFQSTARQPPVAQTLLPVGLGSDDDEQDDEDSTAAEILLYEPSVDEILDELGPAYVKNLMYRILLSSVASEQLARRVAMKNATDSAGEMQKNLTRDYNKARQAAITQEIAEIVGGVEALK